ncbi:hypothetical protein Tsubulata_030612 [Turnera subulata]|uniref:cysteine dioxygenase n=1 Tax=Turnera subulata TaxID=218843 RepID=A0A9Q0GK41_9ROSI|nr:hypothetical protein Tsubulata_030612 [Turnera subulata]
MLHGNFTLDIHNKTKGLRWKYEPTIYGIPGDKEDDIIWLSSWRVGDDLIKLEDGDELQISASITNFHVKRCAIQLMSWEVGTEAIVSDIEKTASDETNTTYFLDHRAFIARRVSSAARIIPMAELDSTASPILLQLATMGKKIRWGQEKLVPAALFNRNKELAAMGMEKSNQGGQTQVPELDTIRKASLKKFLLRRRQRQQKLVSTTATAPLQKLYNICEQVFAPCGPGIVPAPDTIEKLKAALDDIKPADLGLDPQIHYFRTSVLGTKQSITYVNIHKCEKFSMGISFLPPSGVIPLHNHPGMTVFSKLLVGTMHIKSYDWVVDSSSKTPGVATSSKVEQGKQQEVKYPGVGLAKLKVNSEFTAPCNTSILYPADGGNMHCFTAVTACAVLEVNAPPYSDSDGRYCQYYDEHPFANFSVDGVSVPEEEREGHAWLQERDKPEDFTVVGAQYLGPQIVDR